MVITTMAVALAEMNETKPNVRPVFKPEPYNQKQTIMKNNSQSNPMALRLMILFTCCMLVMLYNKSKAASSPASTFKKIAVEFKQNVAKNELDVLVKSDVSNSMQLEFFSAEKKLIKEIAVNSHQQAVIKDMKKGTYSYKFLSNNLTVKSGTLILQ